jgi:hypothetical protein
MAVVHDDDLKCIENVIPPLESLQPDALMGSLGNYAPRTRLFQCGEYFLEPLFSGLCSTNKLYTKNLFLETKE